MIIPNDIVSLVIGKGKRERTRKCVHYYLRSLKLSCALPLPPAVLKRALTFSLLYTFPHYSNFFLISPSHHFLSSFFPSGGRCIKDLCTNSKATKIELQNNAEYLDQYNGFYGRFVHIQGDFQVRLHAVYLLLRTVSTATRMSKTLFPEASRFHPSGFFLIFLVRS